jgi:hypothetical protein
MSLAPLFNAIKAQLLAKVPNATPFTQPVTEDNTLAYVQMWNNQLASWRDDYKKPDDLEAGNKMYDVAMPAIMIEFEHADMLELGAGVQLYDELVVRVHIVHSQLDAMDGTMEQNLEVYALADAVHMALNKFHPAQAVEFIRLRHTFDYNHDMLYHYIIDYGTNYVDSSTLEPIGGATTGVLPPVLTVAYNPSPFLKP